MELFEKTFNLQTGEEIVQPYTAEQIAEVEAEKSIAAERLAATEEANKARESALAKLSALGLTTVDLKALGL